MLQKLESFFMPLAEKIGKNRYLIAVRDGFLLSMPLLIVGSFFLLIANFPIPGWTEFWGRFFGENWASYFSKPTDATFSIMAYKSWSSIFCLLSSRQASMEPLSDAKSSRLVEPATSTVYTCPNT